MCQTPIVCQQCRESMPDIAWNHPCPHWRWTPENVAALESEIILLKVEIASLHDDARCGHEQRFLQWENHGKPIICTLCENADLTARLAEAEAENERLTRWRNLAVAAATAGAEQEVFKRFAESEAIQPIIQAWKDKVASVEQRLAAAEALTTDARDAARYFWEVIHGELSEQRARELATLYPWVDYEE